jgi:hypothetical protein
MNEGMTSKHLASLEPATNDCNTKELTLLSKAIENKLSSTACSVSAIMKSKSFNAD